MTIIERMKRNGYNVEIHVDEDCSSPRDNDGNFLFLGFPHRHYKIGDEVLDPETWFDCPTCAGNDPNECTACDGDGEVQAHNLDELIDLVEAKYKANLVLPVGMLDHGNVHYYLGGGAHYSDSAGWDSGTCGLIVATPESMAARFGDDWAASPPGGEHSPTNLAFIRECMASEIDEYSKWASGECYGIVVADRNGDDVESCWGFIGYEWAESNIDEMVPTEPQPPVLYDVRLTKDEIDSLVDRLGNQHEAHHLTAIDKLEAIDTSEEDE